MAVRLQKYDEDIPEGHGWAETLNRFPEDTRLRDADPPFKIHSRPERGEAIWERPSGKYWTHTQALAIMSRGD